MKTFSKNILPFHLVLFIFTYILVIGVWIGPNLVYADYPDMEMSDSPNPIGSGARAMGIGGAFISIADDATAASWNPGGLLQLKKPEISIVGSYFSGNTVYETSGVIGDIEDESPDIRHLNYFSAVIPFRLFRNNFVFSINYQHLYEFNFDNTSRWGGILEEAMINTFHEDHKHQKGSLNTISPALAIQVHPRFFFGLTCNFWDLPDNGWENITIQYIQWKGEYGKVFMHKEIYEKYDFSGFNMHIGFLFKSRYYKIWDRNMRFRIGGIIKTPFNADIQHEKREFVFINYPENPVKNEYYEKSPSFKDLILKMPFSYGLGISWDFSHYFSMALDVYRTHWDQYILVYPSGEKWSPINRKLIEKADIKPTTQVRMGIEYLIENTKRKIPIRMGAFYDPEPAGGQPDDFYGVSFGSGITYNELFSLDFAYQFRIGKKKNAEIIQGKNISSNFTQHYFYASIIYYLF